MKNKILILAFFFMSAIGAQAQLTFSVSPGLNLNGAQFGYQLNDKLIPYIGLQNFSGKFNNEYTNVYYDGSGVVTETNDIDVKGRMIVPTIGAKYFFIQKDKVKMFGNGSFVKPLLFGEVITDGQIDKDVEEDVKQLKLWGGELGFGMEYFFSTNFSVGGEFGLRFVSAKFNDTYETEVYNPNTGDYEEYIETDDYKFNMSPTFSKISLNFYL